MTGSIRSRSTVLALSLLALALLAAPAHAKRLPAPSPAGPDDGAQVTGVPAFKWGKVKGADRYEFELSADRNFGSIVLGRGTGSFTTKNLAATISKSLPDGEYWWRVRAVNARNKAGRWSAPSKIVKRWAPAPEIVGPEENVVFPDVPLVLRWSAVPRAYKYRVWLATDPGLGSPVIANSPIETSATAFAPGLNLPPGRYFWAVEPVDAAGHRGARSAVGSFVWSWPSVTTTSYFDLIEDPRLADPQVRWNAVPGAVGYEVEINHSDEFSPGSKVCCAEKVLGTSLAPKTILTNNIYHWRVRAIDPDGNSGQWNRGGDFDKNFGDIPPTIANLRIGDHRSELQATDVEPGTAVLDSDSPVVRWDPLPGAASYRVKVWPFSGGGCDLTATGYQAEVAGTAWTPLAARGAGANPPIPVSTSLISARGELVPGSSYCVEVYAISGNTAVRSDVTRLGGPAGPAFRYVPQTVAPTSPPIKMAAEKYLSPATGFLSPRVPVYRWNPVDGAATYWVYVSRDGEFTNIVDVALTRVPVYAPRANLLPRTYKDEDTPYYWAVLPATGADGTGVSYRPPEDTADGNAPFTFFSKHSAPPAQLAPAEGADVTESPVFRWTSGDPSTSTPEGAKSYLLQVATDANFGDIVDQVTTQATSYTAEKAYPADTVLYWRVRVTDVSGTGLAWSPTGTFRRRLPTPTILASNPDGGATIPPFLWSPVQGAVSYDVHVDQADGTRKDFSMRGAAFTPTSWYGTGIWRWQVRARFPNGNSTVASSYSGAHPFARTIPSPDGVRALNSGGRVLIEWEPGFGIKEYRVDIADSDSFATIGQTIRTQNLSAAPDLTRAPFLNGGTLYWRVTASDEGNNAGGSSVGKLVTARRMTLQVTGSLLRGRRLPIAVNVLNAAGRKVRKVKVRLSGRPISSVTRRTNKRGIARFKVRARKQGKVSIRATRTGYRPATHILLVAP